MSILGRLGSSQSGAAAIEFAIVGTVLMMLILGTVEFGRALELRNRLALAADHGARIVLMKGDISVGDIKTKLDEIFRAPVPDSFDVGLTESVEGFRTMTLTYLFLPMVSGLNTGGITLSVQRRIPVFAE